MPSNGYPKLSRQHFAFIAETIEKLPLSAAAIAATTFADALAKTNPQFNRERFLAACGYRERFLAACGFAEIPNPKNEE